MLLVAYIAFLFFLLVTLIGIYVFIIIKRAQRKDIMVDMDKKVQKHIDEEFRKIDALANEKDKNG